MSSGAGLASAGYNRDFREPYHTPKANFGEFNFEPFALVSLHT